MNTTRNACDRLAEALSYPTERHRAVIAACSAAVSAQAPGAAEDVACFERVTATMTLGEIQELYTSSFDLDPRCTLDVGWHVFGESYDRGAFLATLREDLCAAGVPDSAELPDHLTQLLRVIGRTTRVRAGEFAALVALALERVTPVLESENNPYAFLLHAVGATLRSGDLGRPDLAEPAAEPDLMRGPDLSGSAPDQDVVGGPDRSRPASRERSEE